jgi:hypothetical protein
MTPEWIQNLSLKALNEEERLYSKLLRNTNRQEGEEYERLFSIWSYLMQEIALRTKEVVPQ